MTRTQMNEKQDIIKKKEPPFCPRNLLLSFLLTVEKLPFLLRLRPMRKRWVGWPEQIVSPGL